MKGAALAILAAFSLAACGSPSEDSGERTPAENLAVIEDDASPSDELVAEFDRLLTETQAKCGDSPTRIADYTVNVQEQMREEAGIEESLESILRNVSDAIPKGKRVRCIDAFTTYSIVRIKGK